MEVVEGDNQSAPTGSAVDTRPAVRISDDRGQPVAGVEVTFVVTGGGGSVSGAGQTTSSSGIARVGDWTLGSSPGRNTLEARAAVKPSRGFTAQGTAREGGVHHLVFQVQPGDVGVGEEFSMEVALVNAAGNVVPLSGIQIYVGLFLEGSDSPSNLRLAGNRFRDTDNGVAVFRLSVRQKGSYRFRALTDDLPDLGPHGPKPYLSATVSL